MKYVIPPQWSPIGTRLWMGLWLPLLFCGVLTQPSLALPTAGTSATLDELLAPGASLGSLDGSIEFDHFAYGVVQPDTSALEPAEIMVEVITSAGSDDSVLRFRITGASQIIPQGNAYGMEIGYLAHSRTDALVFSMVSLDIDDATLGTTGTGRVQILADLIPQEALQQAALPTSDSSVIATQLGVIDEGDGVQRLFDSVYITPSQQSLRMATTVEVHGGDAPNSGAVLTDFQFDFIRTQAVPEPCSLLLAALAVGMGPTLSSRRKRRWPPESFPWG